MRERERERVCVCVCGMLRSKGTVQPEVPELLDVRKRTHQEHAGGLMSAERRACGWDRSAEVDRCTQQAFASAERDWFAAVEAALNQTVSSTAALADEPQQPRRWVQLRSEDTFQRCDLASIVQVSEELRVTGAPPPGSLFLSRLHLPRCSLATGRERRGLRSERRRRLRWWREPFREPGSACDGINAECKRR
jgi:hypothetical protein